MNSMEMYLEKLRNSIIQQDYPKVKKYSKKIYNMSKNKINEDTLQMDTLQKFEDEFEKEVGDQLMMKEASSSEESYVENCLFSDEER